MINTGDAVSITIGRADSCDIRISDDEYVSPHHATLTLIRVSRRIVLNDAGSTNGTWAGPVRISAMPMPITASTIIRVGRTHLHVGELLIAIARMVGTDQHV